MNNNIFWCSFRWSSPRFSMWTATLGTPERFVKMSKNLEQSMFVKLIQDEFKHYYESPGDTRKLPWWSWMHLGDSWNISNFHDVRHFHDVTWRRVLRTPLPHPVGASQVDVHVNRFSWFSCLDTFKQGPNDLSESISLCWRTMLTPQYLVEQASVLCLL